MRALARRLLHGLRELWVAIGITLVVLAMGEVAARAYLFLRTRPASEPRTRADGRPSEPWRQELAIETLLSSKMRWEPYSYWRREAFAGKHINIDERGLRRTWNPPPAQDGRPRPRVFVFGASEVWGSGVRDDHTLPSELSRYLDAAGVPAEVVNYGESGHVSTQSVVTLLRELQRGEVPDVVVYYGGGSDALSAWSNGATGIPLSENRRRREFNILRHARRLVPEALRVVASRSAMVGLLGIKLDGPRSKKKTTLPPDQLAELTLRAFDANVAAVDALSQKHGFRTSYFWQPCLLTKPQRSKHEQKTAAPLVEGLPYLTELYARVEREWKTRDPGEFTDLAGFFAATAETRYIDYTHLVEMGNREVAAAIGRQLLDHGRLARREAPRP